MSFMSKNIDYILLGLVLIVAIGSLVYHEVKEPTEPIYDDEGNLIGYAGGNPCGGRGVNMEIAKEIASGIKPGMTAGVDTTTASDAGVAKGAGVSVGMERDMAANAKEGVMIRNVKGNIVGFAPCMGAGIAGGGTTGFTSDSDDEDEPGSGESGPGTGMVGGGDSYAGVGANADDDDSWKAQCKGGETEADCKARLEREAASDRDRTRGTGYRRGQSHPGIDLPKGTGNRDKYRRRGSGFVGCEGAIDINVADFGSGITGPLGEGTTFDITYGDGTEGFEIECEEEGTTPHCSQDSIEPLLEHWECE